MTLQRRLILAVLFAAALAWVLTSAIIYVSAREEINELYDTDMVRMAQQMQAVLPIVDISKLPRPAPPSTEPEPGDEDLGDLGSAGLGELAIAAWRPGGEPLHIDPDGDRLPRAPHIKGFTEATIDGVQWRLYYLNDAAVGWRVCVGQVLAEREELIFAYLEAQVLPWVLGLPLLTLLMVWGVRRALLPVRTLSAELATRAPHDPTPLDVSPVPGELVPLVTAMNHLLSRVSAVLEHERRLTADAAHELRTPLAALKAQWEVARRSQDDAERARASAMVEAGIDRLSRLVNQLLTLSRLEESTPMSVAPRAVPADWPEIANQTLSDCLPLSESRDVDIELLWPAEPAVPLPITGEPALLGIMLRNLLDNALRYSPPHTLVTVTFLPDRIEVADRGPGVPPDILPRLGDRFFREAGRREHGTGLGISIARRVAALHGLRIDFANRRNKRSEGEGEGEGSGLIATIRRDGPSHNPPQ
ncbi:ATP-binding protein [Cupriavidus plantarum]|uniref:ATP-binding protein n=1 Tax=Cupriavidus plantarum TaxID=942865 RepID=UPI0015CAFF59|nr:ATP-binding protein [Cupriavidus plantarum]NYI01879.1 two-component system sensor histidine kinase QseC [Cupriavidus plantarum]